LPGRKPLLALGGNHIITIQKNNNSGEQQFNLPGRFLGKKKPAAAKTIFNQKTLHWQTIQ
jgi:hypothetical protein